MGPFSASIFTVQRYNIRATHLLLIATYCYLLKFPTPDFTAKSRCI